MFFDDFSNPDLARYYEISSGVGAITRRGDGLHCDILRAPDGPSSALDYLAIDSLGRPHSPTKKAVVRFTGTEWTLEACVYYDFWSPRNGRGAYLWLVHGDATDRYIESVSLVRSADLPPDSHGLTLVVYDPIAERKSIEITREPANRYWLRIVRAGNHVVVSLSDDGFTFRKVLDRSVRAVSDSHSLVINSQSFAGGASFILCSLRLAGVHPDPAPERPSVFTLAGPNVSVAAADILGALQAGQDIDLRACIIDGLLDLGQVASPITSHIQMQDCRFTGSLVASNPVSVTSTMSFLDCQFRVVGLSNVEFNSPLSMVNCRFAGDTRFIYTHFHGGANFSASTFSEKPFFRVAQASRPVSLYHANFLKGADLSSANFDDLSLSDVAVREGGVTLYKSEIAGTLRMMATLQRDPQPLGSEWELSGTQIGRLVISAGDRLNRREHTGPALWNFDSNIFLRRAAVGEVEFYNVHFARVLDLSGGTFRSRELSNVTYTNLVGEWPAYYSCFISYSSKDAEFAARIHDELEKCGVSCWFAPEDIKIGAEFRQNIEDAIRDHDRLLLILSEHSVHSDWVKHEVEACLELEQRQRRQVLFPIRLDATVMHTERAWAALIRRERHMGDFSDWRDQEVYERAFQRLLRDLKA